MGKKIFDEITRSGPADFSDFMEYDRALIELEKNFNESMLKCLRDVLYGIDIGVYVAEEGRLMLTLSTTETKISVIDFFIDFDLTDILIRDQNRYDSTDLKYPTFKDELIGSLEKAADILRNQTSLTDN